MENWYDCNFSGKRVLLVEDQPINTWVAKQILEKVGFEVTTAADGREGLQKFVEVKEGYFDAILMDINMPVMDGWMATSAIRELEQKNGEAVPIIAMTTNGYEEDIRRSFEVGMNEHLIKPVEPKYLIACLAKYMS